MYNPYEHKENAKPAERVINEEDAVAAVPAEQVINEEDAVAAVPAERVTNEEDAVAAVPAEDGERATPAEAVQHEEVRQPQPVQHEEVRQPQPAQHTQAYRQPAQNYYQQPHMLNPYLQSPHAQSPYKAKRPERNGKGSSWVLKAIAAALIIGILGGACFGGVNLLFDHFAQSDSGRFPAETMQKPNTELAVSGQNQNIPYTNVQAAANGSNIVLGVSEVVENVMPAMVAIDVVSIQTVDPFEGFSQYFGFGFGGYEQEVPGAGSGIIIGENESELLIATNNHVVGDATEIAIEFIDGESVGAYVKGTDKSVDLAVVAVSLSELKPETRESIKIAVMGNSDSLKLGEPAIAIGNALGYGQSVTVGYISALEREVNFTDGKMTLLQTDAAVNPGNSGGALLNIRGEVIGINSAKYTDTDVESMGFAIPISDAIPIINELMNAIPESERPYLGIQGQEVPESYRNYFDWPEGVYVVEVAANSPAALAGLRQGDIIVGYNGTEIKTMDALQEALKLCSVGDTATLSIVRTLQGRGGIRLQNLELSAVLIARSDAAE